LTATIFPDLQITPTTDRPRLRRFFFPQHSFGGFTVHVSRDATIHPTEWENIRYLDTNPSRS